MGVISYSKVRLVTFPLDDLSNVIEFATLTDAINYIDTLPGITYDECNYLRSNRVIKVPTVKGNLMAYNYIYFHNSFEHYFAFIDELEYIGERCTAIHYTIDPWMTYQYRLVFEPCFVVREHILKADDKPGFNTLSEPLPCSKLVHNDINYDYTYANIKYIIGCKRYLDDTPAGTTEVYGSMFACGLYCVASFELRTKITQLETLLSGNVLFVQAIPLIAEPDTDSTGKVLSTIGGTSYINHSTKTISVPLPNSLEGYTPDNKKLLCYPYCYLTITACNGAPMEYCYENFYNARIQDPDNPKAYFMIAGECTRNPVLTIIPKDYEGQELNIDKKCLSDTYPSVPYYNDNEQAYNMAKAFMASQTRISQTNILSGAVISGINMIGQVASENYGGAAQTAATGGVNYEFNLWTLQQQKELNESKLYDNYRVNARTYNSGSIPSILLQMDHYGFRLYRSSITAEYARIADDYLTKNGYSCMRLKRPNTNTRSKFNFVQTAGANIEGIGVPKPALDAIKQAFDSGITIWHDPQYLFDYSNNV